MLQKIRAHTHGWFAWVVIIGLAFVFTLWGVSGYLISDGNNKVIAKVGDQEITESQVQQVYGRLAQQNQVAQLMAGIQNPKINEKALENQAIQQVIMETLLTAIAHKQGFAMSREQVDNLLRSMPQFQIDGKFSLEAYEQMIRQLNFTPEQFRHTVQEEMLMTQVQSTIAESVFIMGEELDNTISLVNQTRDIQYVLLDANQLAKNILLTETELKAYYDSNHSEFMTTETADLSYVLIDKAAIEKEIKATIKPTDQELKDSYNESIARYTSPERRSASHILLTLPADAKPEEVNKVKQEAEDLYKRIKAGEAFEKLAKEYSKDPGSADNGGSLGFFGPGEMVPDFESAVYKGQKGEVLAPVRTEFGYHIIKIDDIKKAEAPSFDKVKDAITEQWYEDKVLARYESEQSKVDNLAFENPDNLQEVSAALSLPIQTLSITKNLSKNQGLAKNPMLLQTVFGEEPLAEKQNSEVIALSPTQSIVMNITAHHMPALKPFNTVESEVKVKAAARQGLMMARHIAENIKTQYALGTPLQNIATKENFKWTMANEVTRQNIEIPREVVGLAFTTPMADKPVINTLEIFPDKIAAVVVNKIIPGKLDPSFKESMLKEFQEGLLQFIGHRDYVMYIADAKKQLKIVNE